MKQKIGFMVLALIFISHYAWADVLPVMRISVENTDTHIQTLAVKRFADELRVAFKGKIDVQFYSNAQLFRGKDVIDAMIRGHLEMAVPGTWHISKYEPNVGIFLLPMFYGRERSATYDILDSPIGKRINRMVEEKIGVVIPGRWIDLGHAHLFSLNNKINRHDAIKGMTVRVAGGIANKLRIDLFQGKGVIIPWPDLPEYLEQGKVDAVLTSYETVRSAGLWQYGIRYAFEDKQYFPQYVPLIRASFWNKLSDSLQTILKQTWEAHVDRARNEAALAQQKAKQEIIRQGIEIVVPDEEDLIHWRNKLAENQQLFLDQLMIDKELAKHVSELFQKG